MTTPTPARAAAPGDGPADDPAPSADCWADAAGALTFALSGPPRSGSLLLRRRRTDPVDEVLLPLASDGDGRTVAVLDRATALAEGRWDAYLHGTGEASPRRLAPGVRDLRVLLSRVPDGGDGRVAVRIPYPTKDGFLAVRSWLRAPHAEAGELHVGEAGLTVHGTAFGTPLTGRAVLELRGRAAPRPVLHVLAAVHGAAFSGTFAYRSLTDAAPQGFWDLWLRPAGDDGPRVRIARLLDDIADKKSVVTFPARRLTAGADPEGPVDVRPYYTVDNDLAVSVRPAQAAQ